MCLGQGVGLASLCRLPRKGVGMCALENAWGSLLRSKGAWYVCVENAWSSRLSQTALEACLVCVRLT